MANATILPAMKGKAANFSDGLQGEELSNSTAFFIFLFLLIVATILSNSLVFFAVYAFRGLRTITNCFVLSLASADLSVALLAMPVWLVIGLMPLNYEEMMLFDLSTKWIEAFCSSVSIYSATLVSLDRYLAINKPLRYREMVTRSRANKAIACTWIVSLVVAAITFIQFQSNTGIYVCAVFIFVVILCIPLSIMVFAYVCIYRAAVEQLSKMKYHEYNLTSGSNQRRNLMSERRQRFYKELCITKTLAITVSLFVIAWAPFLVLVLAETFYYNIEIPVVLYRLILFLPYINSFVNPWIYAGINKDFRKALKKLVCSPHQHCLCIQKDSLANSSRAMSAASTGRTLISSFQGDDQTGSFKGSHSRWTMQGRQDMQQCTSV